MRPTKMTRYAGPRMANRGHHQLSGAIARTPEGQRIDALSPYQTARLHFANTPEGQRGPWQTNEVTA